ncbi:MAG: class I SAM-dependent methyltransferase [Erysipelotrichaceae bacterium]|nr:class I SAM-dependent methyltransferase [Erysipelotrichaceae bacterium]MDD3810456.1 class I SAM-dependent methyltransferase [Erysipelotrichaceae bacterium]
MEKCKICGGNTRVIRHEKFGTFHWCEQCDFIFKDPQDYVTRDEELKIYNNHNNSIDDPRYVAYFKKFIDEAIVATGRNFKTGFDFGSGPSPVLATILERDYGIEMEIYDLNYAPEKVYLGKKYDLVTCTEVIEHLENPQEYFDLLAGLMKQDSLLALMTLFHPDNEADFLDWHYIRDRTHISLFSPKAFAFLGAKSGLEVVYHNDYRYITFKKK